MATWTLGEALESALASILNEVGDGDVGASPDAVKLAKSLGKEAGTDKAPASQEVVSTRRGKLKTASVTTQPGKAPASRANGTGSPVHSPAQPQRRTGRPLPFLIVDNGDRPERREEQLSGRSIARAGGRGGNPASNWVVVVGGRHAALR